MKLNKLRRASGILLALVVVLTGTADSSADQKKAVGIDTAQIPKWSSDDLKFFLHGSMSTEVVPEPVLRAFIKIYPDLFPSQDLSHLGLVADRKSVV